jgi:hypothetical protein
MKIFLAVWEDDIGAKLYDYIKLGSFLWGKKTNVHLSRPDPRDHFEVIVWGLVTTWVTNFEWLEIPTVDQTFTLTAGMMRSARVVDVKAQTSPVIQVHEYSFVLSRGHVFPSDHTLHRRLHVSASSPEGRRDIPANKCTHFPWVSTLNSDWNW